MFNKRKSGDFLLVLIIVTIFPPDLWINSNYFRYTFDLYFVYFREITNHYYGQLKILDGAFNDLTSLEYL